MNTTTTITTISLPVWATGYKFIRVSYSPPAKTEYEHCQFCGAKAEGHHVSYILGIGRNDGPCCPRHANELLDSGLCLWYNGTVD